MTVNSFELKWDRMDDFCESDSANDLRLKCGQVELPLTGEARNVSLTVTGVPENAEILGCFCSPMLVFKRQDAKTKPTKWANVFYDYPPNVDQISVDKIELTRQEPDHIGNIVIGVNVRTGGTTPSSKRQGMRLFSSLGLMVVYRTAKTADTAESAS